MTIRMYGPVSANGLNMNSINVDANCAGIMCVNRSLYFDAYVSLQSARPVTVPAGGIGGTGSLNLAPSDTNTWQMYIPPGHIFSLPIPDNRAFSNMTATYSIGPGATGSGTIWFAAVPYYQTNPAPPTGQQNQAVAPTGFADVGYCLLTFFTWDIGDDPPVMTASSLTSEMTGQPRIVALPPGPAFKVNNSVTPTPINTYVNVNSFPSIGNFPFTQTAHNSGTNGFITVAIYSFILSVNFTAVTFQNQQMWCRMVVLDSGSNVVSSLAFADGSPSGDTLFFSAFFQTAGTTLATIGLPAPTPVGLAVAIGTGAPYTVGVQVKQTGNSGGPFPVQVSGTYDISGFFPPTAGSLDGPGGTLSAIAYNQYQGFSY